MRSDDEVDAFVRQTIKSTSHPCGSCRMGEDAMAAVDSELRVRGLDRLRVVNSSVVPSEPNANLNAPTIMLAERAADMIRGHPLLPSSNAPAGLAEGWENASARAIQYARLPRSGITRPNGDVKLTRALPWAEGATAR